MSFKIICIISLLLGSISAQTYSSNCSVKSVPVGGGQIWWRYQSNNMKIAWHTTAIIGFKDSAFCSCNSHFVTVSGMTTASRDILGEELSKYAILIEMAPEYKEIDHMMSSSGFLKNDSTLPLRNSRIQELFIRHDSNGRLNIAISTDGTSQLFILPKIAGAVTFIEPSKTSTFNMDSVSADRQVFNSTTNISVFEGEDGFVYGKGVFEFLLTGSYSIPQLNAGKGAHIKNMCKNIKITLLNFDGTMTLPSFNDTYQFNGNTWTKL